MIKIIVFSYNRALQLDGTIKSFLLHCKDFHLSKILIIYKTSTSLHYLQYQELISEYAKYPEIEFIEESLFKLDTIKSILCNNKFCDYLIRLVLALKATKPFKLVIPFLSKNAYVGFLVDDNLFVEDFNLSSIIEALEENQDAIGFSLRLGKNTRYCYPLDKSQMLPEFVNLKNQLLKYKWVDADTDFGYPLELSSSLYRTKEIMYLLLRLRYDNPNSLEGLIANNACTYGARYPFLICFENSVTFCNPINKVQNINQNRSGKIENLQSDELANKFQAGYRINVEAYNGFIPNACHQEVELVLVKEN